MGEIKKYEKCQNPYEILNQKKLWRRDDLLSEFCLIKYLIFFGNKKVRMNVKSKAIIFPLILYSQ